MASKAAEARQVIEAAESCQEWVDAWQAAREAKGLTGAAEGISHWRNHISQFLGSKSPKEWTPDDLRQLVAYLDGKIQAGTLSWKMARYVWGTARKMCKDACRSKVPGLRCREDDPALLVEPPDRGVKKSKVFLYPDEFLKLLECELVPLHWRQRVAASIYLGTRAGEFDALEWADIDLKHQTVNIHRAVDRTKGGATKGTKTKHAREFDIEPNLIPLLVALRKDEGLLFPRLSPTELSPRLRVFLKRAGVTREALHTRDATRKQFTWHDLRTTHATWSAIRGDSIADIKFRLGHDRSDTTDLYVISANHVRRSFGKPFPRLPDCLLTTESSKQSSNPLVENSNQHLLCWNLASPTRFELVLQP